MKKIWCTILSLAMLLSVAPLSVFAAEETVELPVVWNTETYDPTKVDFQLVKGEVVLPADIENRAHLKAELVLNVRPKSYEVWAADPLEVSIEVPVGTGLDQLNQELKRQGLSRISVQAVDLETDFDAYTFCDISVKPEGNESYQPHVPGEYTLTASLPDNFVPLDQDVPGPILVHVETKRWAIQSLEPARMDAWQSVSAKYLENIPTQVKATLENGEEVLLDAQWNWNGYEEKKDTVGEHILSGELLDLPPYVMQPEGDPLLPVLLVNILPVNYKVTRALSGDILEGDAGLTLAELTAALQPQLILDITSETEGVDLTTEYVVNVALEEEKNPDFDPEYADLYVLEGTLLLPGNITCPSGENFEEILLQTNPVEVLSVEPAYALADEGTAFEDLTDLPAQVLVTLSCVGADGENKKLLVDVDWRTGEGYEPFPEELTDDNSVTMEVTGLLDNCPQYVNGAGVEATLVVTMTRVFEVVSVSPARIPDTGTLAVDLGSGLEKIYAQLESHSVELTLRNSKGETGTVTLTFTLRPEENPDYDPMAEVAQELTAYLPLPEKLRNPAGLGVTVAVKPTKYTISTIKATRLNEPVESGTPFAQVPLPGVVTVVRNDKKTEELPVTWNGSNYNPTKLGSQVVRGTLVEPLPVHLTNPNNRQPSAAVTIVSSTARILSMEQLPRTMLLSAEGEEEEELLPGFTEYCYLARILQEDGSVTEEVISIFVENE